MFLICCFDAGLMVVFVCFYCLVLVVLRFVLFWVNSVVFVLVAFILCLLVCWCYV